MYKTVVDQTNKSPRLVILQFAMSNKRPSNYSSTPNKVRLIGEAAEAVFDDLARDDTFIRLGNDGLHLPSFKPYPNADARYREWDLRLNLPADDEARAIYVGDLLAALVDEYNKGTISSICVGGIEIGTVSSRSDYGKPHVHVAVIFKERRSLNAFFNGWKVDRTLGYYAAERNKQYPYSTWWMHHTKGFSKISQDPVDWCLLKKGTLPNDVNKQAKYVKRSETEKKQTLNESLMEMKSLFEMGKSDNEIFELLPSAFVRYGAKVRSIVRSGQGLEETEKVNDPHIWLYGAPGKGKTQLINFLFPDKYLKDLTTHFWNGFDPVKNRWVLLEDLDHEAVGKLGSNFFKQLTNEAGHRYDQKYEVGGMTVSCILVTANHNIREIFGATIKFCSETVVQAMQRRFLECDIENLLPQLGLKLINKYDQDLLKKKGNLDSSKLFIDWDYVRNEATGAPIQDPEYYRQKLRDFYYN